MYALLHHALTGTEGSIVIKTTAKDHIVKTMVEGSGTARVWNLERGIELARVNADAQSQVVMFSPHNRYLAFADRFGAVHVARLSISDLYEEACKRLGRNLPEIEWRQYFGSSEPYQQTCPK